MIEKPLAAALSSGGKDSILALHLAWQAGYNIAAIVTMLPQDPESMLYHVPNVNHVNKIAEAIGIKWVGVPAAKEREEKALSDALRRLNVNTLVTGGISSLYQKKKFDYIASSLAIDHYAPLWGTEQNDLLRQVLNMKMEVIFVSVSALGLGEEWLGRHLDENALSDLKRLSEKYFFNISGEGGEYETFVLDAPLYSKKLLVLKAIKKWIKDSGVFEIIDLVAVKK